MYYGHFLMSHSKSGYCRYRPMVMAAPQVLSCTLVSLSSVSLMWSIFLVSQLFCVFVLFTLVMFPSFPPKPRLQLLTHKGKCVRRRVSSLLVLPLSPVVGRGVWGGALGATEQRLMVLGVGGFPGHRGALAGRCVTDPRGAMVPSPTRPAGLSGLPGVSGGSVASVLHNARNSRKTCWQTIIQGESSIQVGEFWSSIKH